MNKNGILKGFGAFCSCSHVKVVMLLQCMCLETRKRHLTTEVAGGCCMVLEAGARVFALVCKTKVPINKI